MRLIIFFHVIILGWLLNGTAVHASDFVTDRRDLANSSIIFCSARTWGEIPDNESIYGSATLSHQRGKIVAEISIGSSSIDPLKIEDAVALLNIYASSRTMRERENSDPEVIARGEIPPYMWDQLPSFLDRAFWWVQSTQIDGKNIKMTSPISSTEEKDKMKMCIADLIAKAKKCYKHMPPNDNETIATVKFLATEDCR